MTARAAGRRARRAVAAIVARWRGAEVARERRELVWAGGRGLERVTAERWSTWEPGVWAAPGVGRSRLGDRLFLTETDAAAAVLARLPAGALPAGALPAGALPAGLTIY